MIRERPGDERTGHRHPAGTGSGIALLFLYAPAKAGGFTEKHQRTGRKRSAMNEPEWASAMAGSISDRHRSKPRRQPC
jgi:hypothetical protein